MASEQSSAAVAAQQVQAIVEAAEATAREIEENARVQAKAIREQAERDAAEHVTRARQLVELLSAGAEQLQGDIDDVVVRVDGLKAAIDAVKVDLVAAEADITDVAEAETAAPAAAPASFEPAMPERASEEPAPSMAAADVPEVAAEEDPEPEPATASAPAAPEGVRLIALNMALSGKPREETARYLRENFQFEESAALLDEVYAKAGS